MMKKLGQSDSVDAPMDDIQRQILAAKQQMHPGENIRALEDECRGRCRNACNAPGYNT